MRSLIWQRLRVQTIVPSDWNFVRSTSWMRKHMEKHSTERQVDANNTSYVVDCGCFINLTQQPTHIFLKKNNSMPCVLDHIFTDRLIYVTHLSSSFLTIFLTKFQWINHFGRRTKCYRCRDLSPMLNHMKWLYIMSLKQNKWQLSGRKFYHYLNTKKKQEKERPINT